MIYMIAAMAKNRVIGNHGKIPWDLPEDREHFKNLTMGHSLVMGRKSYEEIGFPLPGRKTYLVSSTLKEEGENITTVHSLSEVIQRVKEKEKQTGQEESVFICGGGRLYRESLPFADKIYLTELRDEAEGDVFFPKIDKRQFVEINRQPMGWGHYVEYVRRDLSARATYPFLDGMVEICSVENKVLSLICKMEKHITDENRTPFCDNIYHQLVEYTKGKRKKLDIPYVFDGTEFQKKVWRALMDIPYGETKSYKEIAETVGSLHACRAVGMACNKNPLNILVPCHRVIGSNGNLTGFAGGLEMKRALLALEKKNRGHEMSPKAFIRRNTTD